MHHKCLVKHDWHFYNTEIVRSYVKHLNINELCYSCSYSSPCIVFLQNTYQQQIYIKLPIINASFGGDPDLSDRAYYAVHSGECRDYEQQVKASRDPISFGRADVTSKLLSKSARRVARLLLSRSVLPVVCWRVFLKLPEGNSTSRPTRTCPLEAEQGDSLLI